MTAPVIPPPPPFPPCPRCGSARVYGVWGETLVLVCLDCDAEWAAQEPEE